MAVSKEELEKYDEMEVEVTFDNGLIASGYMMVVDGVGYIALLPVDPENVKSIKKIEH